MAEQVEPVTSHIGEYAHVDDLNELLTQRFSYEYNGEIIRNYELVVGAIMHSWVSAC
jgi:hypothetical protein